MRRILSAVIAAIILLMCAVSFAADEQLIKNGGFGDVDADTGLPKNWRCDGWLMTDGDAAYEVVSVDGRSCVHIINMVDNDFRLYQEISVKPDSFYKITCDIKTLDVVGGAGANISIINSLATSEPLLGTNDWQTVSLVGKTGKSQKTLTVAVRVGGYGNTSKGEAWFSNISVEKLSSAPEGTYAEFATAEPQKTDDGETRETMPYFGTVLLVTVVMAAAFVLIYKSMAKGEAHVELMSSGGSKMPIILMLAAALLVRLVVSFAVKGYKFDITCFTAWASHAAEVGMPKFYETIGFCDYPPGYMYVLWLIGKIGRLFNISSGSAAFAALVKLPSIIADLILTYVVYKMCAKRMSKRVTWTLTSLAAFSPLFVFMSSGWGQIDQLLAMCMFAAMYLFIEDKKILAGLVYGAAILIKPQALLIGPLFAVAYLMYIIDSFGDKGRSPAVAIGKTLAAVVSAVALIFVASLPFKGNQGLFWFLSKYFGTATSYNYASVEAFNLFALLGGNWVSADTELLFMPYSTWGTIFIVISVVYGAVLYICGRKSGEYVAVDESAARRGGRSLILSAAFVIAAIFTLGHFMHERYIFPAVTFILISVILYNDRRLLAAFGGFSVGAMLNAMCAMAIAGAQRYSDYKVLTVMGSIINIASFIYFTYVCTDIMIRKRYFPLMSSKSAKNAKKQQNRKPDVNDEVKSKPSGILPPPTDNKLHLTKRDALYCGVLTLVYAIVALTNLGTMQAPETEWKASAGETADIYFSETEFVGDIRVFTGLYEGRILLTSDNDVQLCEHDIENGEMYRWTSIARPNMEIKSIKLTVVSGKAWINEIAFFDAEGNAIPFTTSENCSALGDEPEEVPLVPSYMNGMYFDELYHARTAFEHLHGIRPYENSHPPLGKVIISIGIAVFGMNAFGWRIMGVLFGIGMVPIMYMFARRLFKRSDFALVAAGLFAFDFMHYTQTRIATIDVYGVFFILLMFYYMYQYYCMNFYVDGFKRTLKPLGLAGLFFGLGAASKWICLYAGAGLAIILFTSLIRRFVEYRRCQKYGTKEEHEKTKCFFKYLIYTLLICCVFYIVIPVAIYIASYIPYMLCESHYTVFGSNDSVWSVQEFMFNYHSGLKATHNYSSSWYEWPFTLRPVWYYVENTYVAENCSRTISAFGNPAVWWISTIGTIAMIAALAISDKIKKEKGMFIVLMGVAANLLPWVLVTRCTFAYHFFATVPFIILCTLYFVKYMEERFEWFKHVKWVWLALAIVLFALFYPVLTGTEVPRSYIHALEWLPRWTFLGY